MFMLGKPMKSRREYTDLCDNVKPLELRAIERTVLKNFDSICVLLKKPDMIKALRQPNVLVILPKLAQMLRDIWNDPDTDALDLSCISYWRIVLRTLADQSWELMNLVRDNPKDIDKPKSQPGQLYFHLSFSLSCIQLELGAMFPNNKYAGYRITGSEAAADWWQRQFGRSDIVTWHDFQFALAKHLSIKSLAEANDLKRDINITCSDHVSTYEFDIFVRLFAPWSDQTVDLWRVITRDHPAFVRLRFKEVKGQLKGQRQYSYLFRRSTNTPAVWSIGYINEGGNVTQILVKPNKTIVEALTECEERGLLLFPAGKDSCHAPRLDAFLQESSEQKLHQQQQQAKQQQQQQQQQQRTKQEQAAARPPAEEIYIVAPELQCSQCSRRSDEVTSMDSCEHVLCDLCFDRYVQPRLYENWSMQTSRMGLPLLCPVCQGLEEVSGAAATAASKAEALDIDLISLDDDPTEAAAMPTALTVKSAWEKDLLSHFDPMSASATPAPKSNVSTPETLDAAAPEYALPQKTLREDPRPIVQTKQTNPFLTDYTPLLSTSSSSAIPPVPAVLSAETPRQHAGYLFYGGKEDVEQLLRQIPGLQCVPLPAGVQLNGGPGTNPAECLYSQLWDGKTG